MYPSLLSAVLFIPLVFAMYDAHCHLTDERLFSWWKNYLHNFVISWWSGLVTVGTDSDSNKKVIALVGEAESVFSNCLVKWTIWYHPYECVVGSLTFDNLDNKMRELHDLYASYEHCIVAIGESGIDLHYDDAHSTLSLQQSLLMAQCEMALQLWLPIVVHSRNAFLETMSVLSDFPDLVVYFHCRSYGPVELDEVFTVFHSPYIWFCSNITYKNTDLLTDSLAQLPLESLLLETDSPYLPIQSKRWLTNEPAFIGFLYDYIASYLSLDKSVLLHRVWLNFKSLYHL